MYGPQDKVIDRKLSTVLTAGTLVYSSVLTDDMATYCLALKVRPLPPPRSGIPPRPLLCSDFAGRVRSGRH